LCQGSANSESKFHEGKLVPTSYSFPLSIINLGSPSKYVIDLNFRGLINKDAILNVSRGTVKSQREYQKQNPLSTIKSYSVELPMGSEAFGILYAGSSCYLVIPNFMTSKATENILKLSKSSNH
jgi:hypothetical protein